MQARVVSVAQRGCVVQVEPRDENRYGDGCPYWAVLVPGEPGGIVDFERQDVLAVAPTQEQAQRAFEVGS